MKTEDQRLQKHQNEERKKKNRAFSKKKKKKKINNFIYFLQDHLFLSSVHHLYSCKILADQISLVHSTNCYLAFDLFITIFRIIHVEFILELFYLVGNTILYSIP